MTTTWWNPALHPRDWRGRFRDSALEGFRASNAGQTLWLTPSDWSLNPGARTAYVYDLKYNVLYLGTDSHEGIRKAAGLPETRQVVDSKYGPVMGDTEFAKEFVTGAVQMSPTDETHQEYEPFIEVFTYDAPPPDLVQKLKREFLKAKVYTFGSYQPGGRDYFDPRQPRRPKGNKLGGQWMTVGAVVGAMTSSFIGEQSKELQKAAPEIKALPVPDAGPDGFAAGESIHAGSFSFYRVSSGTFCAQASFGHYPTNMIHRDTAEEALQAAEEMLRDQGATEFGTNWKKRLRGGVHTKKSSPQLMELHERIAEFNRSSPAWRDFSDRWGLDEEPILLNEKGMKAMGKDVLTHGFFDPDTDQVFISGDMDIMGFDLAAKLDSTADPIDVVMHKYTAAHTVRHEYAHQAWFRMTPEQQAEFTERMPSNKETLTQLSEYAGVAKEFYGEEHFSAPWQGEVWAELVATVTDPEYDRDTVMSGPSWERVASPRPEWIRELGDWVLAMEPSR